MIDDDYAEVNLTPSVKSLELKFNLRVGSPTDNDSYGEESFESEFQSSPSKKDSSSTKALKADSSKASPKRQKTPKSPRVGLMEKLAKAESERYEDDDDFSFSGDELEEGNNKNLKQNQGQEQSVEEEGQENFGDMNLDDFLQRFGDGDNEDTGGEPKKEDPSLRPLEGMSPPANADSRDLINSMKLNSPSASAGMSDGNGGFTTSPLSLEAQTQRLKDAISAEESNAAKVDALLRKLNVKQRVADVDEIEPRVPYPVMHDSTSHIANNYKHPKHETKFEAMSKLPLFDKYNTGVKKHHDSESSGPTEHSTRDSNLLAAQVASLKADLKRRDDRLGRIVEHDALITSKCESLTREVAFLKQGLHDAQLECGAQTKRAENALKVKKYKKKAGKTTEVLENEIKVLTESNERLVGRESALLEAVS